VEFFQAQESRTMKTDTPPQPYEMGMEPGFKKPAQTTRRTFRPPVNLLARQQSHDYHLKAAEHCELASRCHKEAALHISGGDLHAASSQSKLADEHTGYAMLESLQACSMNAPHAPVTPQTLTP
jgi:hypothetical protein